MGFKMYKKIISTLIAVMFIGIMVNVSNAEGTSTGKEIFEKAKCNVCHSITSQSIEAKNKTDKTVDLSNAGNTMKLAELKTYLKKDSELNGKKHPKAFKGEEADFDILVKWIATLKTAKAK